MISNAKYDLSNITIPELQLMEQKLIVKIKSNETPRHLTSSYEEALDNVHRDLRTKVVEFRTLEWNNTYCPYFTTEEVNVLEHDVGNVDDTVKEYEPKKSAETKKKELQDQLKNTEDPEEIDRINSDIDELNGISETGYDPYYDSISNNTKSYGQKIAELQDQLKNAGDQETSERLYNKLISLGWNPDVDYNNKNSILAKDRIITMESRFLFNNNSVSNLDYSDDFYAFVEGAATDDRRHASKEQNRIMVLLQHMENGAITTAINKINNIDKTKYVYGILLQEDYLNKDIEDRIISSYKYNNPIMYTEANIFPVDPKVSSMHFFKDLLKEVYHTNPKRNIRINMMEFYNRKNNNNNVTDTSFNSYINKLANYDYSGTFIDNYVNITNV